MDGNDFNLITPVNSMQSIGSMHHVERRQERKRKDKHKDKQKKKQTSEKDSSKVIIDEPLLNRDDPHRIDFKA